MDPPEAIAHRGHSGGNDPPSRWAISSTSLQVGYCLKYCLSPASVPRCQTRVPMPRSFPCSLRRSLAGLLGATLLITACSDDDGSSSRDGTATSEAGDDEAIDEQRFPDVIDVVVERRDDAYDFRVTISSPYDSSQRYADGWRVMDGDGTVYGEHELLHDHADEQPFTRAQQGVSIPDGVDEVVVEGRDSSNGYGGETLTVELPES
jgi:hypothetical protein